MLNAAIYTDSDSVNVNNQWFLCLSEISSGTEILESSPLEHIHGGPKSIYPLVHYVVISKCESPWIYSF